MARRYKSRRTKRSTSRVYSNRRLRSASNPLLKKILARKNILTKTKTYTTHKRRKQTRRTQALTTTPLASQTKQVQFKTVPVLSLPKKLNICVKRQQRKEVIHALRHSGKSGQKRPNRNQHSNIHC